MAEITKVTTPMIPRENMGKSRPLTEQAFELNNPGKVNKPTQDKKILDRDPGGQSLREALGRAAVAPLLRDGSDTAQQLQKLISILRMGLSTSDIISVDPIRQLLDSMFVPAEDLLALLTQQSESSVLFKGEPFDVLRDIAARFENIPHVRDALVTLLKTFDFNVNLDNSVKTILSQCENLLDYMFAKDKSQFGDYLEGLGNMLLPQTAEPSAPQAKQTGIETTVSPESGATFSSENKTDVSAENGATLSAENGTVLSAENRTVLSAESKLGVEPKEAAAILKSNLLPLLGEIVVKYYQNANIRDIVMVVVHNLVRVDKGTPEALKEAVDQLTEALGRMASLSENFSQNLSEALARSSTRAKLAGNDVMDKFSTAISQTLRNPESSPAALRQAENLLLSLLHNQSSLMSVMHYILPMQTQGDNLYAEMYVDPDSDEKVGKIDEPGRKIFLAVESERHGSIELCFWETGERVELSMWCPEVLVEPLRAMRRPLGDLMLAHGYTMAGFSVDELVTNHSVIQVFPKLLERKVGIDVRV